MLELKPDQLYLKALSKRWSVFISYATHASVQSAKACWDGGSMMAQIIWAALNRVFKQKPYEAPLRSRVESVLNILKVCGAS